MPIRGDHDQTKKQRFNQTGMPKKASILANDEVGHGRQEPERKRYDVFHSNDDFSNDSDSRSGAPAKPLDHHE